MNVIVLTHNGKLPSEGGLRLGYQGGGKVFLFGGPPDGIPVAELLRHQAASNATRAEKPPDFTSFVKPGTTVLLTFRGYQTRREVWGSGHTLAAVVDDMVWDTGANPPMGMSRLTVDEWFTARATGPERLEVVQKKF